MEPMVWNADTIVHQTVRVQYVTSLLQMVHVIMEDVNPDSKETTAQKVTL